MALLETLIRIEKKYGEVQDDSLGILYEHGLNTLRVEDDGLNHLVAAEALIEWEKHYIMGHYQ